MESYKLLLDYGILSQKLNEDFLQEYLQRIDSTDLKSIVLDLGGIDFVDSACIAFIVKLHKHCKKINKQFFIERASFDVKDILHKMNLDRVIPIVD